MLSGFAPVSTSCSLGTPAGARMLIAVRLNMYLCDWSGWADQKPGEKDLSFRRAAHLPLILFRSGAESKRSHGQEGDGTIRGEMRRSPRIQDVCLMLFDTWADYLCQTWGESFNKEVPLQRLLEEAARGEKEAARPQEKVSIPEMFVWQKLLRIHKFIFHQPSYSQEGRPFGHVRLVRGSTAGKAALSAFVASQKGNK